MEKFEKRETHPMAKYIGQLVKLSDAELRLMGYGCDGLPAAGCGCNEFEVVGYSCGREPDDEGFLIADASQSGGWSELEPFDFISKECKYYWYVNIIDLKNR